MHFFKSRPLLFCSLFFRLPDFTMAATRMKDSSVERDANLDEVLEGMMKNNEALKKHIDSNSSFELEETTVEDVIKQEKVKDIDAKLAVFAKESSKFKYIPNPENSKENEATFNENIKEVFKKVLPDKIIETLSSKKCGLCEEEFEELRWAHRHFTGYNHRGAIKSFLKGTLQTHPPYFKMVWQAVLRQAVKKSHRTCFRCRLALACFILVEKCLLILSISNIQHLPHFFYC